MMFADLFGGSPHDPRQDRFEPLSSWLRAAMWIVALLAIATVAVPDRYTSIPGVALVGVVVAAPLLRTAWFALRWGRRRDRRFSAVACGVLVVVATGVLVAWLTS